MELNLESDMLGSDSHAHNSYDLKAVNTSIN